MAIERLTEDLAFISKMGDNPKTDDGITTEQFKAEFDKAALLIQRYVNDVLAKEIDSLLDKEPTHGPVISVCGKYADGNGNVTISAENVGAVAKSGGTMTGELKMSGNKISGIAAPTAGADVASKAYVDGRRVTWSGIISASAWSGNTATVTANGVTSDNIVIVGAAPGSVAAWQEAGVVCTGQGANKLTFTCDEKPDTSLTVNAVILK